MRLRDILSGYIKEREKSLKHAIRYKKSLNTKDRIKLRDYHAIRFNKANKYYNRRNKRYKNKHPYYRGRTY